MERQGKQGVARTGNEKEFFFLELKILCLGAKEPLCCSQLGNEVCQTVGFYSFLLGEYTQWFVKKF